MADTLIVNTGKLREVNQAYEDLHTTMASEQMPVPDGYDRSLQSATDAATVIAEAVGKTIEQIGDLATSVWDVAQWYTNVDACVVHDMDQHR